MALLATACANPEDTDPLLNMGGTGGTSGGSGGGSGAVALASIGRMLDAQTTCTNASTVCAKLQIPSDMSPDPALLHFTVYNQPEIPTRPPDGLVGSFPAPELAAGEEMHFELTDAGLSGPHWMFVVIYMPREGQYGVPAIGDYVMTSAPHELMLDGSPLNLEEPVTLRLYSAE